MRIGMLLDKPFPPDPRVANEARSLVQSGHAVHLLCVDPGGDRPPRETWEGVEVHRLRIGEQFYKKASALALTVPLYFRFFARVLGPFLERERIDALHVHDLPLLSVGLAAARRRRIPVISDLHENYPAAVATYAYARRFPGKVLVSPQRWRAYERKYLPRADRVLVVVEEAGTRLGAYGISREKYAVVSNTVHIDEFEGFPRDPALEARLRERFTLAYLGGFDLHRGLESVVQGFAALAAEAPETQLLLVGDGATRRPLEERVRALGLGHRVWFEGWQSFSRFPSYVAGSAVCLIPHLKSEHTDTTVPHKLFHYMLLERPVVSTDCVPLARILEKARAGEIYPSGDGAGFARAVRALREEGRRRELGANGRRAVLEEHNWARTAEVLLDVYRGFER